MKMRVTFGLLAFGVAALLVAAGVGAQPPEGKGGRKGPPGGREKGPPRFQLGKVLPPHVREELKLTDEQEKQIEALEKDVKAKLEKILTAEQKKQIEQMRPPGPPGGPPGRGGDRPPPPPPGGERPEPPPADGQANAAPAGGIQWFATWDAGAAEAKRTGRPILLVSAAPHCAGVSGIW